MAIKQICCNCKKEKILNDFSPDKRLKNGVMSSCKLCQNIKKQEYYKNNKDKIIKKSKLYSESNKEKISKQKLDYCKNNKDKISDYQKEYY